MILPVRIRAALARLLPLLLLVSGCERAGRPGETPLVVGAILPLSGPDAPAGNEVLSGMELRASVEGAIHMEVLAADGAGEPIASARRFAALASDPRVIAIAGGWRAATARPLAALAAARGIPLLALSPLSVPSPAGTATTVPLHRLESLGVAAAVWAIEARQAAAAAIVRDPGSETSERLAAAFEQAFTERGGRVAWIVGFDEDGRVETPSGPPESVDVVFVGASGAVEAEVFRGNPRTAQAAFVRTEGWGGDEAASVLEENYVVAFHWFGEERDATVAFVEACDAAGMAPTKARAAGWDAAEALIQAALDGGVTRDGVDRSLRAGEPILGVGGRLAPRGAAESPVVLRVTGDGYVPQGRFAAPLPPPPAPSVP